MDWRELPQAPPLAALLCSTTSAPVLRTDQHSEGQQHFHRLLRVHCSAVHIKYAGVFPLSCNICRARIHPEGNPCSKPGCSGVATLQPNWQVLCVVDDGTGEAALYLEGGVAEALLQLPPQLKQLCLREANRGVREIDLSTAMWNHNNSYSGGGGRGSGDAFFTESTRREVVASLNAVKRRRLLVCCIVIGTRVQTASNIGTVKSTGRELKDGWRCLTCQNQNFPSRSVCGLCGEERASATRSDGQFSAQLQSSSIQSANGIKFVTAALPRLELKAFHVADCDPRTEAYRLLRDLA